MAGLGDTYTTQKRDFGTSSNHDDSAGLKRRINTVLNSSIIYLSYTTPSALLRCLTVVVFLFCLVTVIRRPPVAVLPTVRA